MREGGVDARQPARDRVNVGVAEFHVTDDGVDLATSGLGSCVAVALYDERRRVAGMGHFMLPAMPDGSDDDAAKFVDTGVRAMVDEMVARGANRGRLTAKMAGGGTLLPDLGDDDPIGPQNVEAAERLFDDMGVSLLGRDVGDDYGRSVEFDPETGAMTVVGAHTETIEL
jgi:chemotaxis protein CheD